MAFSGLQGKLTWLRLNAATSFKPAPVVKFSLVNFVTLIGALNQLSPKKSMRSRDLGVVGSSFKMFGQDALHISCPDRANV